MLKAHFRELETRKPFLREILNSFGELMIAGAQAREAFAARLTAPSKIEDSSRLSEGLPLLSWLRPGVTAEELRPALKKMLDVQAAAFPLLKPELNRLILCLDSSPEAPSDWLEILVSNDENRLKRSAEELGLQPQTFQFALEQALKPFLQWLARGLAHYLEEIHWDRGYCPICGGWPDTSSLRKPPDDPGAYLTARGSGRWLHCSRCSHEWRLHRVICPFCGNEDSDSLEYLSAKEAAHEKLYVCYKCKKYLTCMDTSELIEAPITDLIPFELLHLEIVAREKGFLPPDRRNERPSFPPSGSGGNAAE